MCPLLKSLLLCHSRQKRHGKSAPAAHAGDDDNAGFEIAGKSKRKGKKKVDPSLLGFSVESSRIMQGEIDFPE